MMDNPLVSIITPVLNGERFLEENILSVLNQSYRNIEHIFIDGCSTDRTLEILRHYADICPRHIRFVSEKDKGVVDAWNKGLRMAQGKILGELGADDTYRVDAIATIVEFFKGNREAYFVFGDCFYIDEKGEVIGRHPSKDFDLDEAVNDACYIACPSAFYRREVVGRIGLMDESLPNTNDTEYWIRASKQFKLYHIHNALSNFRLHKGSLSQAKHAEKAQALEGFIINRRYGGKLLSPRVARYIVYKYVGWLVPLLKPLWRAVRNA